MRYYNENPRETALRKIVEKQRDEIKELHKIIEKNVIKKEKWIGKAAVLQQELDIANETIEQKRKIGGYYMDKCELMSGRMSDFNSLPWYKKMFYKFKI